MTGRTKTIAIVKPNLVVPGIKDKNVQDRVSKVLKSGQKF